MRLVVTPAGMLASSALRQSLAAGGREHILQNCTWNRLGNELSLYYEQLRTTL
jgi:hypothetical protein